MPIQPAVNPGAIDWSGENPGILLKEDPDGPFSAMALFFRIAYSPAGQGEALLLFEKPTVAESLPAVRNVMISTNKALGHFLADSFIAKLGAFAEAPAFAAMQHVTARNVRSEGDPLDRYAEIVETEDFTVELHWSELSPPIALELPPSLTGPKDRELFTVLVEAGAANILIDGAPLPGVPMPRVQAGIETTTAFLYFSETWIVPEAPAA